MSETHPNWEVYARGFGGTEDYRCHHVANLAYNEGVQTRALGLTTDQAETRLVHAIRKLQSDEVWSGDLTDAQVEAVVVSWFWRGFRTSERSVAAILANAAIDAITDAFYGPCQDETIMEELHHIQEWLASRIHIPLD